MAVAILTGNNMKFSGNYNNANSKFIKTGRFH